MPICLVCSATVDSYAFLFCTQPAIMHAHRKHLASSSSRHTSLALYTPPLPPPPLPARRSVYLAGAFIFFFARTLLIFTVSCHSPFVSISTSASFCSFSWCCLFRTAIVRVRCCVRIVYLLIVGVFANTPPTCVGRTGLGGGACCRDSCALLMWSRNYV